MSKPNLPPLPMSPESVYFEGDGNEPGELVPMYSGIQMRAYAEEAVRQALEHAAVKIGELSQKAFEQPEISGAVQWAYHQTIVTILTNPPETRDG